MNSIKWKKLIQCAEIVIIASVHDGEKIVFFVEIVFLSDFTLENSLSKNKKEK